MKLKCILLLMLSCSFLSAYDYLLENKIMPFQGGNRAFIIYENNLYYAEKVTGNLFLIPQESVSVNANGYLEVLHGEMNFIIAPGEGFSEAYNMLFLKGQGFKDDRAAFFPSIGDVINYPYDIEQIHETSYLSETIGGRRFNYTAYCLLSRYFEPGMAGETRYNHFSLPWVEGAPGPGLGEGLIIEFTEPLNEMSILNGYVDFSRMNLFKENSRVKKLKVSSPDGKFEFEYNFEDMVYFAQIKFPSPAKRVVLEIAEVYPGSKYSDTCISAVAGGISHLVYDLTPANLKRYLNIEWPDFFN